jgi:transposase-like protein
MLNESKKIELIKTIINLKEIDTKRLEKTENRIKKLEKEIYKLKGMPKCPKCGSKNVIKHGTRKTLNRGVIQKFWCKKCGEVWSFRKKEIDYRMRNDIKDIRRALYLRKKGYTLSQIAEIIGGISRTSVRRWIHRFQPPEKEKIVTRNMGSRWGGEYKRSFKIKI